MASTSMYEISEGPPDAKLKKPFFDYASMSQGGVPLVIDNGSSKCRAGWATETSPRLEFDNIVAKYRNRKVSSGALLLVGDDVHTDAMAKSSIRSGFDNGVLTNFDAMENVLDYIFAMLGCTDDRVTQPIVMTETLCPPYASRRHMSELLFECYSVPSVTYGVDAAWSYYQNTGSFDDDALIVDTGNVTSHVIPLYDARIHTGHTKRLNLGGQAMDEYLLKLLHLKYPTFPMKITEWQAHQLIEKFAYVAEDYDQELTDFLTPGFLKEHDQIVQFPFPMPTLDERTAEEIEQRREQRREQMKKMQESLARKRQEQVEQREQELKTLLVLRERKLELETGEFIMQLKDAGLASEQELDTAIDSAQVFITRAHNKEMGITEPEDKQPPSFPLLEIPDEELTDEQKQEKLKQKQQKALFDGRERERLEKEKARLEQEELERQDDELRTNHFDQWLAGKIAKRSQILSRIEDRRVRRKELHDRRSHASQQRMRSIADLAANETTTAGNKRRRRGDQDDDFGAEDDDWNVYRDISKEDDDEEEEADLEELEKNTKVLEQHAMFYLEGLDRDARAKIENTTIYRFTEGCLPAILDKPAAPQNIDNAAIVARAAREYQLHLNLERIRVPEVL
ncbi:Nuclear actin-protein involved in chromatin remodeling, partial [Linderina macrospora]